MADLPTPQRSKKKKHIFPLKILPKKSFSEIENHIFVVMRYVIFKRIDGKTQKKTYWIGGYLLGFKKEINPYHKDLMIEFED